MQVKVGFTKFQEVELLQQMEEAAFEINKKYFKDGILPGPPEEEKMKHTWRACFDDPAFELVSIYDDEELIGGARVKRFGYFNAEMELFFISPEYQGKGIGAEAFISVENLFPEVRLWCFVTPTQVVRNAAFYVNKCGYAIVEIAEYDDETDSGMYVFEKVKY